MASDGPTTFLPLFWLHPTSPNNILSPLPLPCHPIPLLVTEDEATYLNSQNGFRVSVWYPSPRTCCISVSVTLTISLFSYWSSWVPPVRAHVNRFSDSANKCGLPDQVGQYCPRCWWEGPPNLRSHFTSYPHLREPESQCILVWKRLNNPPGVLVMNILLQLWTDTNIQLGSTTS